MWEILTNFLSCSENPETQGRQKHLAQPLWCDAEEAGKGNQRCLLHPPYLTPKGRKKGEKEKVEDGRLVLLWVT